MGSTRETWCGETGWSRISGTWPARGRGAWTGCCASTRGGRRCGSGGAATGRRPAGRGGASHSGRRGWRRKHTHLIPPIIPGDQYSLEVCLPRMLELYREALVQRGGRPDRQGGSGLAPRSFLLVAEAGRPAHPISPDGNVREMTRALEDFLLAFLRLPDQSAGGGLMPRRSPGLFHDSSNPGTHSQKRGPSSPGNAVAVGRGGAAPPKEASAAASSGRWSRKGVHSARRVVASVPRCSRL